MHPYELTQNMTVDGLDVEIASLKQEGDSLQLIQMDLYRKSILREQRKRLGIIPGPFIPSLNQLIERFWSYADMSNLNGCWNWKLVLTKRGYGAIRLLNRPFQAHRFSKMVVGYLIPPKMLACHTCDNRKCVNPDHIYIGTPKQNSQDMVLRHRVPVGERRHNAVLSDAGVIEMRRLRDGGVTLERLAAMFNTTSGNVHRVCKRRTWTHI